MMCVTSPGLAANVMPIWGGSNEGNAFLNLHPMQQGKLLTMHSTILATKQGSKLVLIAVPI